MAVSKSDIFDFLKLHRYAVQASLSADGSPQAALVGFVANERLQLLFDSFDSTRKVANLRRDPRVALVIGGYTTGDERTVQYEGIAETPSEAELEELKQAYFAVHPDGLRRAKLPGITYFRVRPLWIRYTDLNTNPPQIVAFEDMASNGPDVRPSEHRPVWTSTQLSEPWQPDMERKPVFSPVENPQHRTTGRS